MPLATEFKISAVHCSYWFLCHKISALRLMNSGGGIIFQKLIGDFFGFVEQAQIFQIIGAAQVYYRFQRKEIADIIEDSLRLGGFPRCFQFLALIKDRIYFQRGFFVHRYSVIKSPILAR